MHAGIFRGIIGLPVTRQVYGKHVRSRGSRRRTAIGVRLDKGDEMAESVYKVIELVGSSTESWEKAAAAAVETASKSLRDLRVAEVLQLDMHLEEGKILAYRVKLKVSFKYEHEAD